MEEKHVIKKKPKGIHIFKKIKTKKCISSNCQKKVRHALIKKGHKHPKRFTTIEYLNKCKSARTVRKVITCTVK